MDRVFLDANILFSVAWQEDSGLVDRWRLDGVRLVTSEYALDEAMRNLPEDEQRHRLERLLAGMEVVGGGLQPATVPAGIELPSDDLPILLAAAGARATHLLTGDIRHFGRLLGRRVAGVLILRPAQFLAGRARHSG